MNDNLWTELDVVHYFQGERVVTKENMYAKKTNQAEITQCLIERARSKFANKLAVVQWPERNSVIHQTESDLT